MKLNFFAVRIGALLALMLGLALAVYGITAPKLVAAAGEPAARILGGALMEMAVGAALLGVLTILWIRWSIRSDMDRFRASVAEIAAGKLTHRVQDNWLTTGLAAGINQIIHQEKRVICEVATVAQKNKILAEQLTNTIEQNETAALSVAETISHIAENASEQAAKSNEARQVSQDMAQYAVQISQDAEKTLHIAEGMLQAAQQSGATIGDLISKMDLTATNSRATAEEVEHLKEEAHKIDIIVAAVTDISQRTNLLALNAAIEAARAGDAGRGFAVVADEVRKLAEQSSQSAGEINRLLDGIVIRINEISHRAVTSAAQVSQDVVAADESRVALITVDKAIQETYGAITRIRSVAGKTSDSAALVDKGMDHINASIQETAAGAEEVSASAEEQSAAMLELSSMAGTLNTLSGEVSDYLEAFIQGVKIGEAEKKKVAAGHELLRQAIDQLNRQGTAPDRAGEFLKKLCAQNPAYEYIGILDLKGDMVAANVPMNGVSNYAHRPYFKEAVKGNVYCSEPYISNVSYNYCLALAVPYRNAAGSIAGAMMADLCIEQ